MWSLELLVISLMILINAVFAAYEIALASVSVARLDILIREQHHGARAARHMKEGIEASLAVVQLGITLVGVIAAATGGSGAEENLRPYFSSRGFSNGWAEFLALSVVVVPLTFVTIVVGELVPKVFAIRNKEWVCLRLSPLMQLFGVAVWPAVWLFEQAVSGIIALVPQSAEADDRDSETTLQELHALATLARTSRLIGARQEGIIINASRLSSRSAGSIMLPAEHICLMDINATVADSLLQAHQDMHTRFPVTSRPGDPQSIIGYVNFKDLVACLRISPREPSLKGLLRPLVSFREDQTLTPCLERLIHEHTHIALVRDTSGRIVGMITLEDILEELVGDIRDEFDRLPAVITATGSGWMVCGGAAIEAVRTTTGLHLSSLTSSRANFNDWLTEHLGRPPRPGEELRIDDRRVLIRKTRRNAVLEAIVEGPPRLDLS